MAQAILVTGSEGFIGSHLVEALVRDGYSVSALVQYNSFSRIGWLDDTPRDIIDNVEIVFGDVRDPHQMRRVARGKDHILHLAALIAIPYSYQAPQSYVENNITGTLNLLEAARDFQIPIIHTSTSEVYGTAEFVPITESHPLKGQSPYSASKIGADQLALSFHSSFETAVKIVRPFNTYGPRQSLRAVIPTIITQLLNSQTNIQLGALSPTRDFTFVEDTVAGFLSAIKTPDCVGEVVNLGSGFEISIEETANLIADIIGVDISIREVNERLRPEKSEVERLFACNKKAEKLLQWKPTHGQIEGFRLGLEKTIKWFEGNQKLISTEDTQYVI